jgi:hypothetical protein
MKAILKQVPMLGGLLQHLRWRLLEARKPPTPFPGTAAYWEKRYSDGGNSGVGSYTLFAEFKAEVLNRFVATHRVQTVIEFGCGDGNQLLLAEYPAYVGFDISPTTISHCRTRFDSDSSKAFHELREYNEETAELSLSLDVIYHLVEDELFIRYMRTLFEASTRYVIIYSSNTDDNQGYEGSHIRHRKFTKWIEATRPRWKLIEHIPNRYPYPGFFRTGSFADFFIYEEAD